MKLRFIVFILLAISLFSYAKQEIKNVVNHSLSESNNIAGNISSKFKVDAGGSSVYIIPLKLPPGTNKVQPNLALTYNSAQGNGALGVGWSVSGLSSITRCSTSKVVDGVKGSINFDLNDRYCIDGERLILVQGSQNGIDGSTYKTERDSGTLFTAKGACEDSGKKQGPCSFTAITKNGSKLEFGNSDDSRILASNSKAVRVWAINKVSDRRDNYVLVNYEKDGVGGYLPQNIEYTGNDVDSKNIVIPQRKVNFDYEERSDIITSFVDGAEVQTTKRLKSISTYVKDDLVKQYNLNYKKSISTNRSLLENIYECDANNNCLTPTTFSWQENQMKSWVVKEKQNASESSGNWLDMDVNGDGLIDIVNLSNGSDQTFQAYLSKGDGTWNIKSSFDTELSSSGDWLPMDVNGDGLIDIVNLSNGSDQTFQAYLSKGDGTWNIKSSFDTELSSSGDWLPMDVNGDGLIDIVNLSNGRDQTFQAYLSKGDGTWSIKDSWSTTASSNPKWITMDINGDGMVDIVNLMAKNTEETDKSTEVLQAYLSKGDGTWSIGPNLNTKQDPFGQWLPMDVNGDGLIDIVNLSDASTQTFQAFLLPKPFPDLLNKFISGSGKITSIEYKPITDNLVYQKGKDAVYPYVDVQTPRYVVSNTKYYLNAQESKPNHQFNYFYHNLQGEANGRGWLGFSKVIKNNISSEDKNYQTQTVSDYHQVYPLTGLLKSSTILKQDEKGSYEIILNNKQSVYNYKTISPKGDDSPDYYIIYKDTQQSDFYTQEGEYSSNYNYTQYSQYSYDDSYQRVIMSKDALSSQIDISKEDDLQASYTCFEYFIDTKNTDINWKNNFVIAQKITNNKSRCKESWSSPNSWKADTDLRWIQFEYDSALMNRLSQSIYDDNKKKFISTSQTYDKFGNIISRTDALNNTTNIQYDDTYNTFTSKVVLPAAKSTLSSMEILSTYEPNFGIATSMTDLNGNVTFEIPSAKDAKTPGYDGFGRILNIKGIDGNKSDSTSLTLMIHREFNQSLDSDKKVTGIMTSIWQREDWNNDDISTWSWSKNTTDGFNRIIQSSIGVENGQQRIVNTTYNHLGKIDTKSLPYFNSDKNTPQYTKYKYNILGNIVSITQPQDIVHQFQYDKDGLTTIANSPNPADNTSDNSFSNISATVDFKGLSKTIIYPDENGEVKTDKSAKAYQKFDSLGQLIQGTDPINDVTIYTYNSLGQIISTYNKGLGKTLYQYDDNGQLSSITNALNNTIKYTYDNLGRTITRISEDQNVVYIYDETLNGKGKLSSVETTNTKGLSSKISYTFKYDTLGRVIEENTSMSVTNNKILAKTSYEYDALGRVNKVNYPLISTNKPIFVSYSYNSGIGTLNSVKYSRENINQSLTYSDYTALGLAQQIKDENNIISSISYDVLGQIKSKLISDSKNTLSNLSYSYNKAGMMLKVEDKLNKASSSLAQEFTYDSKGQLITASAPALYGKENYSYNLAGDITSKNNFNYFYSKDKPHQITSICDSSVQTQCSNENAHISLSYDDIGRITTKNVNNKQINYIYDDQNNLLKVQSSNTDIENSAYDSTGRRFIRKDSGNTLQGDDSFPIGSTYYISSLTEIYMTDKQSFPTYYAYGSEGMFFSDSLSSKQISNSDESVGHGIPQADTQLEFYRNHINSTTLVINQNNSDENSLVSYTPQGEYLDQKSTGTDDFRSKFSSKELDENTNLVYFGARYYDPDMGIFISPDPAHQSFSPYAYAGNNPIMNIDPDGREYKSVNDSFISNSSQSTAAGSETSSFISSTTETTTELTSTELGVEVGAEVAGEAVLDADPFTAPIGIALAIFSIFEGQGHHQNHYHQQNTAVSAHRQTPGISAVGNISSTFTTHSNHSPGFTNLLGNSSNEMGVSLSRPQAQALFNKSNPGVSGATSDRAMINAINAVYPELEARAGLMGGGSDDPSDRIFDTVVIASSGMFGNFIYRNRFPGAREFPSRYTPDSRHRRFNGYLNSFNSFISSHFGRSLTNETRSLLNEWLVNSGIYAPFPNIFRGGTPYGRIFGFGAVWYCGYRKYKNSSDDNNERH